MNDHPELITRVSHARVEALREVAARHRSIVAAGGERHVSAWRLRTATLLRSVANRLAPVAPGAGRAAGSSAGGFAPSRGSEPC